MRRLDLIGAVVLAIGFASCSDDGVPQGTDGTEGDSATNGNSTTSGGTSTTGAGDGGATAGTGASGTSGGGSTGGETGGPVDMPCENDEDCKLVNNCCTCEATHMSTEELPCRENCLQPLCNAAGISEFECRAGKCSLVGAECDDTTVTCDAEPPMCPPETLPHVTQGCYSGLCIPICECETVPSCDSCPRRRCASPKRPNSGGGFRVPRSPRRATAPQPASASGTMRAAARRSSACRGWTAA